MATLTLPALGAAGGAPLDDLVAQGGRAEKQQQFATERFGFPLYTDTAVVARRASGLPPGTPERTARAAQAGDQHRTPDLPGLRAALPISDSPRSPLAPAGNATTAISYLFFDNSANLDEAPPRPNATASATSAAPVRPSSA